MMFENDEVKEASRVPALVWAIIAGLVSFAVLANVIKSDAGVLIGAIVVAVVVCLWRK